MKSIILTAITTLSIGSVIAEPAAKPAAKPDATTYIACQACHGADAKGLSLGPTLKMAPSLISSELVTGKPDVLALVILKGIQKEGVAYAGVMLGMEGAFADDQRLADVMTYIRTGFGNKATPVTVEEAKAYRAKWAGIKAPVTRAKLTELSK